MYTTLTTLTTTTTTTAAAAANRRSVQRVVCVTHYEYACDSETTGMSKCMCLCVCVRVCVCLLALTHFSVTQNNHLQNHAVLTVKRQLVQGRRGEGRERERVRKGGGCGSLGCGRMKWVLCVCVDRNCRLSSCENKFMKLSLSNAATSGANEMRNHS